MTITLVIHRLAARQLFMLRPLLPSAATGAATTSMPSPQIILKVSSASWAAQALSHAPRRDPRSRTTAHARAPCHAQAPRTLAGDGGAWQSHAVRHSRDPVWYGSAVPTADRAAVPTRGGSDLIAEAAAAAVALADTEAAASGGPSSPTSRSGLSGLIMNKIRPSSPGGAASPASAPKAGVLRLELKRAPLQDIASRRLMVSAREEGECASHLASCVRTSCADLLWRCS